MKTYKFEKWIVYEGKRYVVRADTQRELKEKYAERMKKLEAGHVILRPEMMVGDWVDEWLRIYKEPKVSDSTLEEIKYRINKYLLPPIGHMRMKDVKAADLQAILNSMTAECKSKNTFKKMHDIMKQLFDTAVSNKIILYDNYPVNGLSLPKSEDGTHRSITEIERAITFEVAKNHQAGNWVLTMLYCGLRPQETGGLLGCHIDLINNVLHVVQAIKKNGTVGETKTNAGKRDVPIPPEMYDFFAEAAGKPDEFVFKGVMGGRLTPTVRQKMWHSFKKSMQIAAGCKVFKDELVPPFPIADDLVPYCYRHTFCTDLQDAGVPINVAKDLMGHSSIELTARIYTHMTDDTMKRAAEQMARHRSERGRVIRLGA